MTTASKETKPIDWLEFVNEGEVPINAFKLLGASTKRDDDSKIGYFGSGLKYSLAVLLRENIPFRIFSGDKQVVIGTRKTKFADRTIEVITVNGEKTSITLEAGVDWEPWFALREIYSNTLDENGTMSPTSQVSREKGKTKIYIGIDEKLQGIMDNWATWFSNTRSVLYANKDYAILQKTNHQFLNVFRRGISVYRNRKPSLFDYDINNIVINESRVAKHDYEVRQRCAEALACCDNEDIIKTFLKADSDKFAEKDSDFWQYLFDWFNCEYTFSDTWFKVLKDKRIVPQEYGGFYGVTNNTVLLPERLCKKLYDKFGDQLQICGSSKEQYMILEDKPTDNILPSMKLLEKVGFGYPMDKVKWAKFKDIDVMGQADKGLVLLSEQLDTPIQSSEILHVLFEEVAHAKSGYSDNTRAFQDYLIALNCSLIMHMPETAKKEA